MISGFTFIKHGLSLGYPFLESVQSMEPLCDEVIINVGFEDPNLEKDDGTWDYLNDSLTADKFRFVKSFWDPNKTKGGEILAEHTNIALAQCQGKYCQYLQGDEALHEVDLPLIEKGIQNLEQNPTLQGLVFDYLHFYGNVDIYKHTRNVYRREVRLIKNHQGIKSWKDAQGFRTQNDQKLLCERIKARIFHYGWARQETLMNAKNQAFNKLYHGQDHESEYYAYKKIWGLKKFNQTHPQVMTNWIAQNRNDLDILSMPLELDRKIPGLMFSDFIEKLTGHRLGEYRNYRLMK